MNISSTNRGDPKRKAIKKRLSLWDSFFSKVQNEFINSTENKSCLDSENDISCLQDPTLLSVDDEHNKLRRSLRIEHGINEESEISESEAEWQLGENGDTATDCDNLSGEALGESELEIDNIEDAIDGEAMSKDKLSKHLSPNERRTVNQRKSNAKPKHKVIQTTNAKKPLDKNLGSPSSNKKIELITTNIRESNYDAHVRKDTPKELLEKDPTTEDFLHLKIRKGKVVAELQTPPGNNEERPPKAQVFSTTTKNNIENSSSQVQMCRVPGKSRKMEGPPEVLMGPPKATSHSKNSRTDHELLGSEDNNVNGQTVDGVPRSDVHQPSSHSPQITLSNPDKTAYQINKKLALKEMCKQYDLWKLHERRKSGRQGSIHIVSDLNEELSDANLFVRDLPPVVVNPFRTPRRFSLQKSKF